MPFASAVVLVKAPEASSPSESVSVVAETGDVAVACTVMPPEPTVTDVVESAPECVVPVLGPM